MPSLDLTMNVRARSSDPVRHDDGTFSVRIAAEFERSPGVWATLSDETLRVAAGPGGLAVIVGREKHPVWRD